MPVLPTTITGSLPKPAWLAERGQFFARWVPPPDALPEAHDDAVRLAIAAQEEAGLDVVTDGEQRRRHYIWGFYAGLTGIDLENLGTKGSRGQRFAETTRVPRTVGDVTRPAPVFLDALRFARALTARRLKVTLPGPMTAADSVADDHGGRDDRSLALHFASLLNAEARALADEGADVIQFDEPCFNIYVDRVAEWGVEALEMAIEGVAATTAVHICYGYGVKPVLAWKRSNTDWNQYRDTLPLLAASSIDQVSVECAASGVDVSVVAALAGKDVMVGVIDVGTEEVEDAETVADRIRAALAHVPPERLYPCTDCGLVPRSREAAFGKMKALAAGAALVRAELAAPPGP